MNHKEFEFYKNTTEGKNLNIKEEDYNKHIEYMKQHTILKKEFEEKTTKLKEQYSEEQISLKFLVDRYKETLFDRKSCIWAAIIPLFILILFIVIVKPEMNMRTILFIILFSIGGTSGLLLGILSSIKLKKMSQGKKE